VAFVLPCHEEGSLLMSYHPNRVLAPQKGIVLNNNSKHIIYVQFKLQPNCFINRWVIANQILAAILIDNLGPSLDIFTTYCMHRLQLNLSQIGLYTAEYSQL